MTGHFTSYENRTDHELTTACCRRACPSAGSFPHSARQTRPLLLGELPPARL